MGTIECSLQAVNLRVLLQNGQCFRWRQTPNGFMGVYTHRVWQLIQLENGHVTYCVRGRFPMVDSMSDETVLRHYLQLDTVDLPGMYKKWADADSYFAQLLSSGQASYGIPILAQEPFECLMSFICSQNNNIKRIGSMIEKLCTTFGDSIQIEDGDCKETWYDFPSLDQLTNNQDGGEQRLRDLGFGYRAPYIVSASKQIKSNGGVEWLEGLRSMEYAKAKQQLMTLSGVGPKVADCVLLMSLGHNNVVPIDTHVWQITAKHYMPQLLKVKSLSAPVYEQIVTFYRSKFGEYAGWAQTVLFTAKIGVTNESHQKEEKRQNLKTVPQNSKNDSSVKSNHSQTDLLSIREIPISKPVQKRPPSKSGDVPLRRSARLK